MKKIRLLVSTLAFTILSASCSTNVDSSSNVSSFASNESDSSSKNSTSTSSKVYDTSGNEITSGSASVSFVYGRQTTTKTISAAYLIDGVEVEITSGEYISASSSSDQVVFFLSQAAGKAVFDHRVHAPLQFRSCANQLRVQQRRKSFDHRVGSLC